MYICIYIYTYNINTVLYVFRGVYLEQKDDPEVTVLVIPVFTDRPKKWVPTMSTGFTWQEGSLKVFVGNIRWAKAGMCFFGLFGATLPRSQ